MTTGSTVACAPVFAEDGILRTKEQLDALPVMAVIIATPPTGEPHPYQKLTFTVNKRQTHFGRWMEYPTREEVLWLAAQDDRPKSSEQLLAEGLTYSTIWLPKGTS